MTQLTTKESANRQSKLYLSLLVQCLSLLYSIPRFFPPGSVHNPHFYKLHISCHDSLVI